MDDDYKIMHELRGDVNLLINKYNGKLKTNQLAHLLIGAGTLIACKSGASQDSLEDFLKQSVSIAIDSYNTWNKNEK